MECTLPNKSIWDTASEYQGAAEICLKNNLQWAAAINAALSIEIYLKSFLTKYVSGSANNSAWAIDYPESERGHDLVKLYNNISQNHKELIFQKSIIIDPSIEFETLLFEYKDYFFYGRYFYEYGAMKKLNSDVVMFSSHVKKVVALVADVTHKHNNSPII